MDGPLAREPQGQKQTGDCSESHTVPACSEDSLDVGLRSRRMTCDVRGDLSQKAVGQGMTLALAHRPRPDPSVNGTRADAKETGDTGEAAAVLVQGNRKTTEVLGVHGGAGPPPNHGRSIYLADSCRARGNKDCGWNLVCTMRARGRLRLCEKLAFSRDADSLKSMTGPAVLTAD